MSQSAAEDFLNAIATDVNVAAFTRAALEHPEWMPARAPRPVVAPMPQGHLQAIMGVSGLPADEQTDAVREASGPALGARIALHDTQLATQLIQTTLSTQQAATLLNRDPSNIRRGVQDRRYYAVRVAGTLRLPDWQFVEVNDFSYQADDDVTADTHVEPLPNLAAVVAAIPPGLHPEAVAGFMNTTSPDLDDLTPIKWLVSGGDPALIHDLLSSLTYS